MVSADWASGARPYLQNTLPPWTTIWCKFWNFTRPSASLSLLKKEDSFWAVYRVIMTNRRWIALNDFSIVFKKYEPRTSPKEKRGSFSWLFWGSFFLHIVLDFINNWLSNNWNLSSFKMNLRGFEIAIDEVISSHDWSSFSSDDCQYLVTLSKVAYS